MKLTFYRDHRKKVEIRNRYELIRESGFGKYFNLLVYLDNFQLGHLDIRFRFNNVGKDLCVIAQQGIGDMLTLVFELDKFISFIGRDDVTFEEFLNSSLGIKDACLIQSDVTTREEKAYLELKERVNKVKENYDSIVNFCNRTKPFGKFYSMPVYLLYNKKTF